MVESELRGTFEHMFIILPITAVQLYVYVETWHEIVKINREKRKYLQELECTRCDNDGGNISARNTGDNSILLVSRHQTRNPLILFQWSRRRLTAAQHLLPTVKS